MSSQTPPPHGTFPQTWRQRAIRWMLHDRLAGRTRLRRRAIEAFKRDAHGGPTDGTLFGYRVRFHPQDNQTDAKGAVCGRAYNRRELGWIERHLRAGDVFVDIGANMGFFSLFAASLGTEIVAIEANPIMQQRLAVNFGFDNIPVRLIKSAVGNKDGRGNLHPRHQDLGSTTVEPSEIGTVAIRPLLALLDNARVRSIDMLKIDIEGRECDALLPFFETAPASLHPRFLIMERQENPIHRRTLEMCLLESGLYRTERRSRANLLLARQA